MISVNEFLWKYHQSLSGEPLFKKAAFLATDFSPSTIYLFTGIRPKNSDLKPTLKNIILARFSRCVFFAGSDAIQNAKTFKTKSLLSGKPTWFRVQSKKIKGKRLVFDGDVGIYGEDLNISHTAAVVGEPFEIHYFRLEIS